MRSAHKQKNPTISNVKSLDLWSEWRESNSRPLEPHSSALPKLRYTRISTAASLPKRGDKKYYTQARPFCQQIFRLFLVFSEKSLIFTRIRAFSFLLFLSVLFRFCGALRAVAFQQRAQVLAGKAAGHGGHLFRGALGYDLAACAAALRAKVDEYGRRT